MLRSLAIKLVAVFVFFVPSIVVMAQETSSAQPPTFCFESKRCRETPCKTKYPGHSAKLTIPAGKTLPPNSILYVVESIATSMGTFYSTGYPTVDQSMGYAPKPEGFPYIFKGLFEEDNMTLINQATHPLKTNAAGELTTDEGARVSALEWTDVTDVKDKGKRKFFGISIGGESTPQPTQEVQPTISPITSTMGAQQLGQFPFSPSAIATAMSEEGGTHDCVAIVWDPDGTVFDSQSLEPVPNVSVTLSKKRSNGLFSFVNKFDPEDVPNGILTNPYPTEEDGYFSFFVPDGTYKLFPQISGYNFPGLLTLNENYPRLYVNIYPLLTGMDIVEKGGPEHRDIPVDPLDGKPKYYPIKIMDYDYQSDNTKNVFIDGRVSHPLATIRAYSVIPNPAKPVQNQRHNLLSTIYADQNGRFSLTIDQSALDILNNEMFGEIEVEKAIFTKNKSNTNSLPAILRFEPIPVYLEGYAMGNGKILPNAKVELIQNYANNPYYHTLTDSAGYFKIPSDFISFIPYGLRYSLGSVSINIETSQFITDNAKHIQTNSISLFVPRYTNSHKTNVSQVQVGKAPIGRQARNSGINTVGLVKPTNTPANITTNNKQILIIVVLMALSLIAGFIGFFIVQKTKKN